MIFVYLYIAAACICLAGIIYFVVADIVDRRNERKYRVG